MMGRVLAEWFKNYSPSLPFHFFRDSYRVLCTYQLQTERPAFPAVKKPRVDHTRAHVACLSPNACCIAVSSGENILLFQAGSFILGLRREVVTRGTEAAC